ncbi:MAG: hypothetical protein Q9225_007528 [Loekoesia sp. 1 TL-2023]
MDTSTNRKGHAERDKLLEESLDPQRVDKQMGLVKESNEAKEEEGHDYNTRDWADLIKDEPRRQAWFEERRKRGLEELRVKREQVELRREEIQEMLALKTQLDLSVQRWEIKEEKELSRGAQAIVEMLQSKPSLAAQVLEDPTIRQAVDNGLEKLKDEAKTLKAHIFGLEKDFYKRAKPEVEEDLAQKFVNGLDQFQHLFTAADNLRLQTKEELEDVRAGLRDAEAQILELEQNQARLKAEGTSQAETLQLSKLEVSQLNIRQAEQDVVIEQLQGWLQAGDKTITDLIAEGNHIQQDLDAESSKNQALEQKLEVSKTTLLGYRQSKNEELKKSKDTVKRLQEELNGVRQQHRAELQEARDHHFKEFDALQSKCDGFEAAADTHEEELRKSKDTVKQLQEELDRGRQYELEEIERLNERHAAQLQGTRDRHEQALRALQSKRNELKAAADTHQEERRKLTDKLRTLSSSLNDVTRDKTAAEADLKVLEKGREEAQARIVTLENRRLMLNDSVDQLTKEKWEIQANLKKLASERQASEQEITAKLDSTRQLLGVYAEALNEFPVDPNLLDDMTKCQTRFAAYDRKASRPGFRFERTIPRMLFVPDMTPLGPKAHAINFWLAARADCPSFSNTQALFNANTIDTETAAAYPWVLEALGYAISSMHTWDKNMLAFQKALTVLQGIAYLNRLAQGMQISLEEVERLRDTVQEYMSGNDVFGSEPFVCMVFKKVAASVDGRALTSWIDDRPASDEEAARRLDGSNSGVGAHRCIIADSVAESFMLIDQITVDEVLYMFHESDVDETFLDEHGGLQLQLVEGFVANCLGRRLQLERPDPADLTAFRWIDNFLGDKVH